MKRSALVCKKLRILISSGPTQEPLDPVRYLTNRSTGVMGRCLFEAAQQRGHKPTLIECPTMARTARDLERVLKAQLPKHHVLIMAAAVCDVRPKNVSGSKIKKDKLEIVKLVKNPDILVNLSKIKKTNQVFIGFGLESENILKNGLKKLKSKSLEAIVLQEVTIKNSPFGNKNVKARILTSDGQIKIFSSVSKIALAGKIITLAEKIKFRII